VLVYCVLMAAFTIGAVVYGVYSLSTPADVPPTLGDFLLQFMPLGFVVGGLVGFWFMRWWGVAAFWLCVLAMMLAMSVLPPEFGITLTSLVVNAVIWVGLLALPPTAIAAIYRRQFR
jgi:hypothetical protein